ncbi:MAG: helix-turn-helix domain-containing protein [Halobacteriales archaeon]
MVIATKLYVEHPDLPLSPTLQANPEVEFGVFTDASIDPEHDVYIFWIDAADYDALRESLEADHTVASFSVVVEGESRWTFLIEYSEAALLVTPVVVDVGGLTVESRSYSGGWELTAQLPDHDALFALNEFAKAHEVYLDVLELHQGQPSDGEDTEFGLTDAQREALVTAYRDGFYDVPRTGTLEDLASTLDISLSAASGRIKRGSRRLVERVLIEGQD